MILIDSFFTFFLVIEETYIKKDKVCREVFKYLEKGTGGVISRGHQISIQRMSDRRGGIINI